MVTKRSLRKMEKLVADAWDVMVVSVQAILFCCAKALLPLCERVEKWEMVRDKGDLSECARTLTAHANAVKEIQILSLYFSLILHFFNFNFFSIAIACNSTFPLTSLTDVEKG